MTILAQRRPRRGLFGREYDAFMYGAASPPTHVPIVSPDGPLPLSPVDAKAAMDSLGGAVRRRLGLGAQQKPAPLPTAGATVRPSPPQAAPPPGAAPMTTSGQGREFIRRYELDPSGQPYFATTPDDFKNPTWGYGHKVPANERASLAAEVRGVDRNGQLALMERKFRQDVALAEARVRIRLGPDVTARLTQGQFDALVADAYNAGGGGSLGPKMLGAIRRGDMATAAENFDGYSTTDQGTGVKSIAGGLIRRNLEERAMFERGDYAYRASEAEVAAARRKAEALKAARSRGTTR